MTLVQTEPKKIYIRVDVQIPYLCFTANTAGSTIRLDKYESPTSISLETSTDGVNWTSYPAWSSGSGTKAGTTITLSNIGDKVYWRNTSETTTAFSTTSSNYYRFIMSGSIDASGDISYLINKNGTTTIQGNNAFLRLFESCSALRTCPSLTFTTLTEYCYHRMFRSCSNLETLPILPALIVCSSAYEYMFYNCSKIKLSTTQTGEYQTAYRIPETGIGTLYSSGVTNMFYGTGGTFTGDPSINTTYYTSNTLV